MVPLGQRLEADISDRMPSMAGSRGSNLQKPSFRWQFLSPSWFVSRKSIALGSGSSILYIHIYTCKSCIYIYTHNICIYTIYIYTVYIYIYTLEIHEPLLPKPLERPGFFLWPSHSEGLAVTCSTKGSKARKPRATALPRVWAEARMDQGLGGCRVYEWFMGGLWMGTLVRFELSKGRLLEAMGVPPKFQNSYARIWKKSAVFRDTLTHPSSFASTSCKRCSRVDMAWQLPMVSRLDLIAGHGKTHHSGNRTWSGLSNVINVQFDLRPWLNILHLEIG